jgi:hypothetical protein
MFKGQYYQRIYWFAHIALLEHLCDNRYRARASATSGAGNEQEGMSPIELGSGPDSIYDFIAILSCQLCTHLVYLAHPMTPCFAATEENAMQIIGANMSQASKVSLISIDSKGACDYIGTTMCFGYFAETNKFIGNPGTTLP